MKRLITAALVISVISLSISCGSPLDYSGSEAFVRGFVQTLKSGGDYQAYYLKKTDFADDESSQMTVARFTEFIKQNYLRRCRNAHDLMKGKTVTIDSVELIPREPKAATFLHSVGTIEKALVNVTVGKDKLQLDIEEIIQVGEEYRLVLFAVVVDHGTIQMPSLNVDDSEK